ncbi:hypothetical protein Poli38472_007280 [Pythium oligandrum]|uniref:RGS domain-containing protein n=1 Tax=Pythium oligandrum TaxID=41045 RepID=A0A8K1CA82_PYTOL|nr:hypothetical protein Poli38472_007280 [Pythium oligandrum]|eukprot:TMW59135.1 hypothetical protein Poli38472_007280 [Pythium oligandrum]
MGAAASVCPDDERETFAILQREYDRLQHEDVQPSDEEVFSRIREVVLLRYLTHPEESPVETPSSPTPDAPDKGHAAILAQPLTSESLIKLAEAIPDEPDEDDGIVAALVSHHSRQLLLDDEFHDEMDDRTQSDSVITAKIATVTSPSGYKSLSEGSFGRSFSNRSTFDLTQNLTPVFTTDVLTDPTTLKLLTCYAERQQVPHGVDRIRFWVEIDQLQLLPSHSYTNRRLRKIYDKFLSPEAPSPVCVTSGMLHDIEKALETENISAGIYADAQGICFTALEKSVFPRFRESKLYKKMMEFCAPAGPISKEQAQQQQQDPDADDFSLMGVLSHPAKLRFLKTYCMEALALENLLFYLEVEDCKRLPNLSFISNKTRKVYDRYCTPSSKNFIAIPENTLMELHAVAADKHPLIPKLFYEAQVFVFQSISEEIWRGFCRTAEYLEYSRKLKPDRKKGLGAKRNARYATAEQSEVLQRKLDAMNEFQLIETAMHFPVAKLIPSDAAQHAAMHGTGDERTNALSVVHSASGTDLSAPVLPPHILPPDEQLTMILTDPFAKKYFKQFMKKRGVDQFLAFCEEVEDFKLLPGIEFLQHSAKKIYRKYLLPSAKLQVDMSNAMRMEIADRLLNPSVDMFKKISARVRHGMLQDSLPRFVKSSYYNELKKLARQFKEAAIENELKAVDAAAKKGKLELAHLDIFLTNQLGTKQFRLFLESQHCSENLMLWEEIEHFRRLPSYQIVLRSAKKIYDKYLNPNNTRNATIPISEALHGRVFAQLEVASRTTFDEVEQECYETMRNVVVPDFLDSRIFMALVGTWAVVDDDYVVDMLRGEFEMAFLRHRFHLVQETKGLSRDTSTPLAEKHNYHATSNGM